MEKLLVVGIDTPVGSNLALALSDRAEVAGISSRSGFELPECRILPMRLEPCEPLLEAIAAFHPTWIIYCGATARSSWDWTNEASCAQEPKQIGIVDRAAAVCGSYFTLVSTDAVFRGPRLFHREMFPKALDQPAAIAAIAAEKAVAGPQSLIVRTHAFSWSSSGDSYAERLWASIVGQQPVAPSGTRYATPILATDLAELLWRAFRKKLYGVYHAGGAERSSMWHFATLLAAACGTPMKVLQLAGAECSGDLTLQGQARCGEETSLDSRKLQRAVEMPLPLLRDGIAQFVEQAKSGYRDQLHEAMAMPAAGAAA